MCSVLSPPGGSGGLIRCRLGTGKGVTVSFDMVVYSACTWSWSCWSIFQIGPVCIVTGPGSGFGVLRIAGEMDCRLVVM